MALAEARLGGETLDPKAEFLEFLRNYRDRTGVYKYRERVRAMISMGKKSLLLDFQDL